MKRNVKLLVVTIAMSIGLIGCNSETKQTNVTPAAVETSTEDFNKAVEEAVAAALETYAAPTEAAVEETTMAETQPPETETEVPKDDSYMLAISNQRIVEDDDLSSLSKDQLRIARNEIFARHGRIYETEDLNAIFSSKSWYTPTTTADQWSDSVLSNIEKENIDRIARYEKTGTVIEQKMEWKNGLYSAKDPVDANTSYDVWIEVYPDTTETYIYFTYTATHGIGMASPEQSGQVIENGNPGFYDLIYWESGTGSEVVIDTVELTSSGFKSIHGMEYKYSN